MASILVMPKLGLTMEEGSLTGWIVRPGETVDVGQPICEVETEKLSVQVESAYRGVMLRAIDPQEGVPVGAPIGVIGDLGEDASAISLFGDEPVEPPATQKETAPSDAVTLQGESSEPGPAARRMVSSPVARKLAAQHGVDLSHVTGTGPDGRITRQDIEIAVAHPSAPPGRPDSGPREATTRRASESSPDVGQPGLIEPSRMRKAIAANMTLSASIPQFTLERDVDVATLEFLLRARGNDFDRESRPTFSDAVTCAVARSLISRPVFLSSWSDGALLVRQHVNVGIAVALSEGLVVPVIEDADRLALPDLAAARRRLQTLATDGILRPVHSGPSVFTVSNLGALGVDRFHALVNPSESGILAIGRVRRTAERLILTLALSCDHRVVDGADGARLLGDIAAWLETDTMHQMFEEA